MRQNWSELLAMEMNLWGSITIPFSLLLCLCEMFCSKKVPRMSSQTFSVLSDFHFSTMIAALCYLPPTPLSTAG